MDGYKDVQKVCRIKVENKKPQLTPDSKNATLYPVYGIESARVQIRDKTQGNKLLNLDEAAVSLTGAGTEGYE